MTEPRIPARRAQSFWWGLVCVVIGHKGFKHWGIRSLRYSRWIMCERCTSQEWKMYVAERGQT